MTDINMSALARPKLTLKRNAPSATPPRAKSPPKKPAPIKEMPKAMARFDEGNNKLPSSNDAPTLSDLGGTKAQPDQPEWSKYDWRRRCDVVKRGLAVVLSTRSLKDKKLIEWATGRSLLIDCRRPGIWGCPEEYTTKGTGLSLSDCLEFYRYDLANNPELLARLPELKGRFLLCLCKEQYHCHAQYLARLVNNEESPC